MIKLLQTSAYEVEKCVLNENIIRKNLEFI